jgi:cell division protein FtsN
MGIGWAYMNKNTVQYYYNAYAGLVPFFYSSPNDYIALNSEKFPIEQLIPKVKAINSSDKSEPNQELTTENNIEPVKIDENIPVNTIYLQDTTSISYLPVKTETETDTTESQLTEPTQTVVENKPEPEVIITKPSGHQYLIIAGAFREKSNADKLIADLRAKGYTAGYAGQNNRGLWMVSIERFDILSEAKERLITIRKEESEDYWILKV